MTRHSLALLIALALLLGGCASGTRIEGAWRATRGTDAGSRAVDVHEVSLSVFGHELTGSDGCSTMKTDFVIADDRLTVTKWTEPDRLCGADAQQVQTWVHRLLKQQPRLQRDGNRLTITGAAGTLELERV